MARGGYARISSGRRESDPARRAFALVESVGLGIRQSEVIGSVGQSDPLVMQALTILLEIMDDAYEAFDNSFKDVGEQLIGFHPSSLMLLATIVSCVDFTCISNDNKERMKFLGGGLYDALKTNNPRNLTKLQGIVCLASCSAIKQLEDDYQERLLSLVGGNVRFGDLYRRYQQDYNLESTDLATQGSISAGSGKALLVVGSSDEEDEPPRRRVDAAALGQFYAAAVKHH